MADFTTVLLLLPRCLQEEARAGGRPVPGLLSLTPRCIDRDIAVQSPGGRLFRRFLWLETNLEGNWLGEKSRFTGSAKFFSAVGDFPGVSGVEVLEPQDAFAIVTTVGQKTT